MKVGMRKPSIKRSIKARTTSKWKRQIRRSVDPFYGKKGMGWIKNPKKAAYNKVYNKTTFGVRDVWDATTKGSGQKKTPLRDEDLITVQDPNAANEDLVARYRSFKYKFWTFFWGFIGIMVLGEGVATTSTNVPNKFLICISALIGFVILMVYTYTRIQIIKDPEGAAGITADLDKENIDADE